MEAPTDGPKESQRLVLSQIRVEFDLKPLRCIHRLVIVNRINWQTLFVAKLTKEMPMEMKIS